VVHLVKVVVLYTIKYYVLWPVNAHCDKFRFRILYKPRPVFNLNFLQYFTCYDVMTCAAPPEDEQVMLETCRCH
jgi:hypothetical protein